jgi:hypothetical protein
MQPRPDAMSWDELEANAHRPEVQEFLRREILRGAIRVSVWPDGGIRILTAPAGGRDGTPGGGVV